MYIYASTLKAVKYEYSWLLLGALTILFPLNKQKKKL